MLSFTGSLKVFVCLEAMDMRKGFEGLHSAVAQRQKERRRMTKGERNKANLEKHRSLLYGRGEEHGVGKMAGL